MRISRALLIFFMLIFLLIGCSTTTTTYISTENNASPETILKNRPEADFFIMGSTVYINVSDLYWVKELTLNEGKVLGKINKTGVKKDFNEWNATKPDVYAVIYELEGRKDIVLIKTDKKYIPYLKYVEG